MKTTNNDIALRKIENYYLVKRPSNLGNTSYIIQVIEKNNLNNTDTILAKCTDVLLPVLENRLSLVQAGNQFNLSSDYSRKIMEKYLKLLKQ